MDRNRDPKPNKEEQINRLHEQLKDYQSKIDQLEFIANVSQKDNDMGTWEVDISKNKQVWSENYCRLLGYSDIINEPDEKLFYSHVFPDDLNIVKSTMQKCIVTQTPCSLEFRYITKNGNVRYARSTANYLFDKDNKIEKVIGVFQDISKGKTIELSLLKEKEKVEESELVLNEMGKIAKVGGWRLNLKTNELTWTKEVYNIHEIGEEFIPTVESAINFYEKSSQKIISKALTDTIEQGKSFDFELKIKSAKGNIIDVRAIGNASRNENGEIEYVFGTFQDISDRIKRENELLKSQKKFKSLFDNIEEGVALHKMIFDKNNKPIDFIWIDANLKYEKLTHLKASEIIGKRGKEVIPNIEQRWYDMYARVTLTGNPESTVDYSEYLNKYWEVKAFRPDKELFAVAMTDVTERIEAEELLRNNEKKYRSLVENIPVGIFRSKSCGEIISANNAMARIYGYDSPEDLMNVQAEDFYTDVNPRHSMIDKLMDEGILHDFITEEKRKDGSVLWVSTTYTLVKDNLNIESDDFYIDGVVIDITKRKQAEIELQKSKERFQIAMQASQDGLFDWNLVTNEIYYSPGWKRMLGYKEDELPDDFSVWESLTEPKDVERSWKMQQDLIQKKIDRFELEFKMKHKNGKWVHILSRAEAVFNQKGEAIRIVGTHVDISELKARDKNIKDLSGIIQNSVNEIYLFDKETFNFIYANDSALENLGYTFDELKNMTPIDIKPEFDISTFTRLTSPLKQLKKDSVLFETKHKRKDGSYYDVSVTLQLVDYNDTKVFSAIIIDVSEKKTFENELISARNNAEEISGKLKAALDSMSDAVFISDNEGNFVDFNDAFATFHKFKDKTECVKTLGEYPVFLDVFYLDGELLPLEKWVVSRALNGESGIGEEYILKRKDINETWYGSYNFAPIRNSIGMVIGSVVTARDITKDKMQEKERLKSKQILEENERILRVTLRTAMDGYWVIDSKANFLNVNDTYCRMTGYDPEELLKMGVKDVEAIRSPEEILSELEKIRELEQLRFETKHKRKNGTTFDVEMSIQYQNIKNGQFVCFIKDISERKIYEQEIIIAREKAEESDRLKTAFLANMSHEIRTPMNGIHGFTELLQDPNLSIHNQKEYARIIQKSSDRLLDTVNDIIDISKIESGQMTVTRDKIDIVESINSLVSTFIPEIQKKNLIVDIENENINKEIYVFIDEAKFSSIVTNLIKNSIKYTMEGYIKIGFKVEGNKLLFYCEDTGIGIPNERKEAVFNRFEQADIEDKKVFEGSGLGLAITKSYVEMMEGKIWVESEVEKGSTFYVQLPYHPAGENDGEIDDAEEYSATMRNNLHVLIAEDDETSAMHLSILCETFFTKVSVVRNGLDAVNKVMDDPSVKIIFMDIKMPIMDGYEATAKIREKNQDVIIVAQTAYAFDEEKQKILNSGFDNYISKPISRVRLAELIAPLS